MTKKRIWTCVLLGISVLLMYYVLRDVKYKDFIKQTSKIDLKMAGFAGICMLLSAWFRNLRWLMLFSPLGYQIKKSQAFSALLLSYPANLIIPQSSFFVRAGYLRKISGVPFTECLGTIIAEKLMDGLVVFGLFFVFMFSNFSFQVSIFQNYKFYLGIILFGFVVFKLASFFFKTYLNVRWQSIMTAIKNQLSNFKIGLMTAQKVDNKPLFVFYTLAIWLPYFAIFYFLLKGSVARDFIDIKLPIELAVMANIGWIFPTQGGLGSYHFLITQIMQSHGFENLQAVFFAFFSHIFIISNDLLLGLYVILFNYRTVFGFYNVVQNV
ncbi:UPF0104 family protein [Lacihabitans sp. CCS-44]|uniref:lysylphosphatidylglycerol synthase transmembrane domain-containing protein n=1 Tax=Lacihabitans sp. CCS-44 TaxID=2487331 RepID=UPI0020CE1975|nr:lysylphosphatidylglycerol synthase transmembrane domain-containing protein [Lacihabitans sp. CCS-44]MCP9757316.1 UPF0104 family protein [Lacihabitans sp. CCS-44]